MERGADAGPGDNLGSAPAIAHECSVHLPYLQAQFSEATYALPSWISATM